MKLIPILALPLFTTGVWTGYLKYSDEEPIHVPVSRPIKAAPAPSSPNVMDEHGVEATIAVEIIPDAVILVGNSEALEYHAEVASQLSTDATYAWSAVAIDDLGRVVGDLAVGEGTVLARDIAVTPSFIVDLPDGFYILRVRVGVVTAESEHAGLAVQFLRVSDGLTREMSATDWYRSSRGTLMTEAGDGGSQ
jgi:hypothetical protein